jgi:adenine-specific DNA methylase
MAHALERSGSMSNDPFTLDMFGTSSLSAGLGLGVTAFGKFALEGANDDEPDPPPPASTPALRLPMRLQPQGERQNFCLNGDRGLAFSWKDRARINVVAVLLADGIEKANRPAKPEEQALLIRFTGFGAGELANTMFRRPGEINFRDGWDELGGSLESAVSEAEYASLTRCTQYAHFTPVFIVRAMWAGLQRLGWRGGRVLEPGIGTGLFPALIPEPLRDDTFFTGVEPIR